MSTFAIPTTPANASWADDAIAIAAARDVTRRHGSGDAAVDALRGVSVSLQAGDFVAVMGPSGSGKSTLMHIMAGLDTPTSGSVAIDGVALEGLKERRAHAAAPRSRRLRLPGLQPAAHALGRRERRASIAPRGPQGRRRLDRTSCSTRSASPIAPATAPPSSRAASSSASPSPAPWPRARP